MRMSTDLQEYSTANQIEAIREYAAQQNYEIVETYADEGRSGLNVAGRPSLRQLIADVQSGDADFEAILVYDVSRWGRFQDADESAYYEYLCKQAGITVHYCAEQFENDGGPTAAIIKSVKRAMAGEYSRELSTKVFMGKCRLIELGFRQGGRAGYGLRRMLVDQNGTPKFKLKSGEQKNISTDRVVLVPGPADEVRIVRRIYELFVYEKHTINSLIELLNNAGVLTDLGKPWRRDAVTELLTNEKYIGNNVFNRRSFRLQKKHLRNHRDTWVRKDAAFEPIVDRELFERAQAIIRKRYHNFSDDEMIEMLRRLLKRHRELSAEIIEADRETPSVRRFIKRFGGLREAYRLAGYTPPGSANGAARRIHILRMRVLDKLEQQLRANGISTEYNFVTGFLTINDEVVLSVYVASCHHTYPGTHRWSVECASSKGADFILVARLNDENLFVEDYYVLPRLDIASTRLLLHRHNVSHLETYRFSDLEHFVHLARRTRIGNMP